MRGIIFKASESPGLTVEKGTIARDLTKDHGGSRTQRLPQGWLHPGGFAFEQSGLQQHLGAGHGMLEQNGMNIGTIAAQRKDHVIKETHRIEGNIDHRYPRTIQQPQQKIRHFIANHEVSREGINKKAFHFRRTGGLAQ
ncbi:hypothetical protein F11_13565 [Rhodospirillum rubrum F11]|nr:hypothetical protein F11_13565 [Rhodospirillum rubrum F11]